MHHRKLVWIALAALWLGGCGGDSRGPAPPPPGTVRLVTEAPLNEAWYAPNRIPNGDFARWALGQSAPDEFQAPDSRYSQLVSTGGPAKQTWRVSDVVSQPANLFRARMALRGNMTYQLIVLAETQGDGMASISLWRVPNEGEPELMEPALLTLLPGDGLLKTYARSFHLPEGGMYMLASQGTIAPESEFSTTWYRWHLVLVEGAES